MTCLLIDGFSLVNFTIDTSVTKLMSNIVDKAELFLPLTSPLF